MRAKSANCTHCHGGCSCWVRMSKDMQRHVCGRTDEGMMCPVCQTPYKARKVTEDGAA